MSGGALAGGDDLGAFLGGIGDVRPDLLDRLRVDQWPDDRARLEPVGDLLTGQGASCAALLSQPE